MLRRSALCVVALILFWATQATAQNTKVGAEIIGCRQDLGTLEDFNRLIQMLGQDRW